MPYVEARGNSIRVKWWGGEYILDAEGNATKRKKYESVSGPEPGVPFQDEEEAYNYGLDREYEVRHGKSIPRASSKTPMDEYCWMWHAAQDLRETTIDKYSSLIRSQIIPYWGAKAVGDITTWEYEAWRKSLKAKVARGELAESYCSQILWFFGILMKDATNKYKLRSESPVATEGRRGKYQKRKREKKRPMEMEILHGLAVNAYRVWGFTGWAYIWTIPFTGMRPPGEMAGLRREYASPNWPHSEPDPELREESLERYEKMPALRVQWQVQYIRGKRQLVDPKYESHRTLVVPPFLHEMHRALLASHDSPWVFPGVDGGQMGGSWNKSYWNPIRYGSPARERATGVRVKRRRDEIHPVPEMAGKRVYLLRHAHREWLEDDGHGRTAMEARMGHEVAGVEGLYANVTPGMELRIAETLQERWDRFWASGVWWKPPFPTALPDDQRGGL
jgi:hypothetical protein